MSDNGSQNLVRISDKAASELNTIYAYVGTWRAVSATPSRFANMPPGTLCSIASGAPVPRKWRRQLGMPDLAPAEVCPVHGVVHQYDCAEQVVRDKPTPRKPRNRRAVNLDDPASAARTIAAHSDDFYRNELIQHLLKTIGE